MQLTECNLLKEYEFGNTPDFNALLDEETQNECPKGHKKAAGEAAFGAGGGYA